MVILGVLAVVLLLVYRVTESGTRLPSQIAAGHSSSLSTRPATTATPVPTPQQPSGRTEVTWSGLETELAAGIRGDAAVGCVPRRHDLPPGAMAAVECAPGAPVERVGFYLFETSEAAIDNYRRRVVEEIGTSGDHPTGWERSYVPCAPDEDPRTCGARDAGWVNSSGYANYRTSLGRIYIGVLGTGADTDALVSWAFHGNRDTPGGPTLYRDPLMFP